MHSILLIFLFMLWGCESNSFDKDKRQIAAKDEVRSTLPPDVRNFDITGFREDTLVSWTKALIKHPIQYTIDFTYSNATGTRHQNTAHIIFTSDGKSILQTQITGRDH
jgi:hypothetical protein